MSERTEIDDLESIKHPCPKYIVHLYTHWRDKYNEPEIAKTRKVILYIYMRDKHVSCFNNQ